MRAAIEQNPLGEVKKASLDTTPKETGESKGEFADPPSDGPENDAPNGPMEAFEGAAQEVSGWMCRALPIRMNPNEPTRFFKGYSV